MSASSEAGGGEAAVPDAATPPPVVMVEPGHVHVGAVPEPSRGVILSVNNIEVVYDHVILVLKGVSLAVPQGRIVALLGANGAGKSTTLKAISNLLHAERGEVTKGTIVFQGAEVQDLTPNELVRRGCIQVMEGRHCFGHLTIEENLLTGAYTRRDGRAAIEWRRGFDAVREGGHRCLGRRRLRPSPARRARARHHDRTLRRGRARRTVWDGRRASRVRSEAAPRGRAQAPARAQPRSSR